jgi:EAL domain-containing protein (putative c-di-GMP-specific phosphodiesterase class I)
MSATLLVIDDETEICALVAEVAAELHYTVEQACTADEVFQKLEQIRPDIIVLDLMMPGMDGVEWLRILANKVRHAKICLISGSDLRVLNSARRLGSAHGLDVFAVFEKPLDLKQLRAALLELSGDAVPMVGGADVAQALATGQITMHYQPVINIADREVFGVEALMRWQHPSRGLLFPADFLEQALQDGMLQPLTHYALNQSIVAASGWRAAGLPLTVAINLTASCLLDLTLPDQISGMCERAGLPTEQVLLEVTETEAMRDTKRTMDVLLRMRLRGIGLGIDDFGTGYSSLRELQRMPFSEMKIDKSFVMDMATNRDCRVIVNAIIDLGHNLGLKIVAEGVEDRRAWEMLADKRCDMAQGHHIAKSMPGEAIPAWVENWRVQRLSA